MKFELIGERYDGNNKWDGAVLAPNGFIYGIPCHAQKLLKIDTSTDKTSLVGDDLGEEEWKWWGGVYGNNGCVYGIPYCAKSILQFHIESEEIKTLADQHPILESTSKFRGGVLSPNNQIYFIPFCHNKVVKLDIFTGSLTEVGDDLGVENFKYDGGVLGNDGNIYCIPFGAKQILKISTSEDKTSFIGDTYPGDCKWRGGILARKGKIYGCPYYSKQILEIDIATQKTCLVGSDLGKSEYKWSSFVVGDNGTIYGTPFCSNDVICYNPVLNNTTLFPLNETILNDGVKKAKWCIGVQTRSNKIYFIPEDHQQVLKINTRVQGRSLALSSDCETRTDFLGRMRAIHTLAIFLARADLSLPLVLGILGQSGSGRTFCINQLLERLYNIQSMDLSGSIKDNFPYAGHMYLIKLDTWLFHEVDHCDEIIKTIFTQLNDQFRFEVMLREEVEQKKDKLSKVETLRKLNQVLEKFGASDDVNDIEKMMELAGDALNLMEIADESDQIAKMSKKVEEHEKYRIKTFLYDNVLRYCLAEVIKLGSSFDEDENVSGAESECKIESESYRGSYSENDSQSYESYESYAESFSDSNISYKSGVELLLQKLPELLRYKKESKMKIIFKESLHEMKKILKSYWEFFVNVSKMISIRCRECSHSCLECFFDVRHEDYIASLMHDRKGYLEPLIEDTGIMEVPTDTILAQDSVDNSVILKGGFSLMKIVEDLNSDGLEMLLKDKKEVYERVKSFKRKGTVTKMFKELINENHDDDKQLLKQKQKERKKKKNKITWKLSSVNATEKGRSKLISSIYDRINESNEVIPESFDEAWKEMELSEKINEFWKVETSLSLWLIAIIIALLVAFLIFQFHAEQDIFENKLQVLLLSLLTILSIPFFGKVIGFLSAKRNAQKIVTRAFSSFDQLIGESIDVEIPDHDLAVMKQLDNEINDLKDRVWLDEGDELSEVISHRLDKYGNKLGVAHQAKKDLEDLSTAMLKKENQKKYFPRGEPRIFLFIDDLDRCSPEKIVEVLDTIQLLLSTKLFVTLVAMDMRYMENFPRGSYYLEKTLQMAYRIPSIMQKEEMKQILDSQLQNWSRQVVTKQSAMNESNIDQENSERAVHETEPEDNVATNLSQDLLDLPEKTFTSFQEEVEYNKKEMDFVAEACTIARTNARGTKRILRSFKILKEIWTNTFDIPDETVTKACIVLLAICGSSHTRVRLAMKKAFWKREHYQHLPKPPPMFETTFMPVDAKGLSGMKKTFRKADNDKKLPKALIPGYATFMSFWQDENEFILQGEKAIPMSIEKLMTKYLSLPWKDWEKYFWDTRAFSFVGDYDQLSSDQVGNLSIAVESN